MRRIKLSKYFIFASGLTRNKRLLEIAVMSTHNLKACQSILPCLWVKGLKPSPIFHWQNSLFCSNVVIPIFLSGYIILKLFVIQLVSSIFQRPAGWLVSSSMESKKVTVTAVYGVLWGNVRAGFKSVVSGPRKFNLLLQGHYSYTVQKGSILSELWKIQSNLLWSYISGEDNAKLPPGILYRKFCRAEVGWLAS